jgi:hypothetical protein
MRRRNLSKACFVIVVLALMLAMQPRQAKGQNPWSQLSGFHSVGVSRVDNTAVVAVLFKPDDKLVAMVVFPAVCDGADCVLSEPGAFFVTDLQGSLVHLHIEPGHEGITHPIFASVLAGFSLA